MSKSACCASLQCEHAEACTYGWLVFNNVMYMPICIKAAITVPQYQGSRSDMDASCLSGSKHLKV